MESQFEIDFNQKHWPAQERFPLNRDFNQNNVQFILKTDIEAASDVLIITGYTSLEYLLEFFKEVKKLQNINSRILLGYEPIRRSNRKKYSIDELNTEIKDYWLDQGFSIFNSGGVIRLIELIKKGQVNFRFSDKLHAKIYVTNKSAMLGSSNLSYYGLVKNKEANYRALEPSVEYFDIARIADNFYSVGNNYNEDVIELLHQLLRFTDWKEALARAIHELLEGEWIKNYPENFPDINMLSLWPSQKQAIAQALYILDNQGSVLIADPTGSGKTRTGACLQLSQFQRLWSTNQGYRANTWVVCPPQVVTKWKREFDLLKLNPPTILSNYSLSNFETDEGKKRLLNLQDARILFIDEAHNFLHKQSNRSRKIMENMADNKILFTATPINKKIEDIMRLIEIMDPDNLDNDALEEYKKHYGKRAPKSEEEEGKIKGFLTQFTIRRTKKQLNELISKDEDAYKNAEKNNCRYPKQKNIPYTVLDRKDDRELAAQILQLTNQLTGILYLQEFNLPHKNEFNSEEIEKYIQQRLNSAKGLARYVVMAMLRSSKIALIEHLKGTKEALKEFKIDKTTKHESGDVIGRISDLKLKLPKRNFKVGIDWLNDLDKYQDKCDGEIKIYNQIFELVLKISNDREDSKMVQLVELLDKHKIVIAFDSKGLTLDYISRQIKANYPDVNVILGKGTDKSGRKNMLEQGALGSKAKRTIFLCSDAMSEGIDLQQSSCVVLLDMPSVMRLIEQRIGRADRLDSPHDEIEIYWPKDSKEFRLATDVKFFKTHVLVKNLFGANIDPPLDFDIDENGGDAEEVIKQYEEEQSIDRWEGMRDAFESVRELYSGKNPVIEEHEFEALRGVDASVKCRLSAVKTGIRWAFFATRANQHQAPQWFFMKVGEKPINDLNFICDELRKNLSGRLEETKWNDETEKVMNQLFSELIKKQRELLPRKKLRALNLLEKLLIHYRKKYSDEGLREVSSNLLSLFTPSPDDTLTVDYYQFAQLWLEILQPLIADKRSKSTRKVIDIKSMETELKKNPIGTEILERLYKSVPTISSLERRIASCIVSV